MQSSEGTIKHFLHLWKMQGLLHSSAEGEAFQPGKGDRFTFPHLTSLWCITLASNSERAEKSYSSQGH